MSRPCRTPSEYQAPEPAPGVDQRLPGRLSKPRRRRADNRVYIVESDLSPTQPISDVEITAVTLLLGEHLRRLLDEL